MFFARAGKRSRRKRGRREGSEERSMEEQTWAEGLTWGKWGDRAHPGEGEETGLTLGKAPERDTKEAQTSQLVEKANWEGWTTLSPCTSKLVCRVKMEGCQ